MIATWRLMLRLARRDLRRHWGRAILTVMLVALPILVVATMLTLVATLNISSVEAIPTTMGRTQAAVTVGSTTSQMDQGTNPAHGSAEVSGDIDGVHYGPIQPLPGSSSLQTRLEKATGATVLLSTKTSTRVVVGDRRIHATALGIDGRNPAYGGMAELTSGRWPRNSSEILVSAAGAAVGIPDHGTFTLHTRGRDDQRVSIVGTAWTPGTQDIVTLPDPGADETTYLVQRDRPVTWAEVQQLNRAGLLVASRAMITHPDQARRSASFAAYDDSNAMPMTIVALLGTGVVLMTALIAGPAFTTSGLRHRRALGQLASNGATHAGLRQYVLAQAIVLGAAASVAAVLGGAGLGVLIVSVAERLAPRHAYGPADVPWSQLAVLAAVGVVSALLAAVAPAVAASRVEVVAVLRGQVSRHRVRAGWPAIGAVLAVLGGVILWRAVTADRVAPRKPAFTSGEMPICVGGALLFGGTVMALPWLLAQVAKLSAVLPLAGRMAARDIGRQRSRAVSGVAAIMGAVALMTALSIGGTSDAAQQRRDYAPQAAFGDGYINVDAPHLPTVEKVIHQVDPTAHVSRISQVENGVADPEGSTQQTIVAVTATGCPLTSSQDSTSRCVAIGSNALGGTGAQIVAMDPTDATRLLRLDPASTDVLRRGGVLMMKSRMSAVTDAGSVTTWSIPPQLQAANQVQLAWGTAQSDPSATAGTSGPTITTRGRIEVPARTVDGDTKDRQVVTRSLWSIVISNQLAAAHGWRTVPQRLDVQGPVSSDTAQSINDRLPDNTTFSVETGYHDSSLVLIRIMVAAFALVVLVVVLIGSALAQAESRADQATLAAIGAPASIRRRTAGAYALVIGLVGGLVGFAVGLVPGIAVTWPLTIQDWSPAAPKTPLINIPWNLLLAVLLGVPLLAALIAAAVTRSRLPLIRRID